MKYTITWLVFLTLNCFTVFAAQAQTRPVHYKFEKNIALPGNNWWDYLAIDTMRHHLFVSHGNAVHVINLATETLTTTIRGLQGVHGIAIAYGLNRGFISDGKSNSVTVFDLSILKKIATIPVTGKDPDCIVYDKYSNQVFTFNGDSHNATVINARSLKVIKTIPLGGSPEFAVADGQGKIYNNLEDKNEIVVINTKSDKVTKRYDLTPSNGPSALAIDVQHERLFTACRKNKGLSVVNALTGKIITTLPTGSGADAARYDPETHLIFVSCGDGTVTIIHEDTPDQYHEVQTLKTQIGARTMALNPLTHKIYLSVGKRDLPKRRQLIPASFHVLVYKM